MRVIRKRFSSEVENAIEMNSLLKTSWAIRFFFLLWSLMSQIDSIGPFSDRSPIAR